MKINEIVNVILANGRIVYKADSGQDVYQEIVRFGSLEVGLLQGPLDKGEYSYVVVHNGKEKKVLGTYSC